MDGGKWLDAGRLDGGMDGVKMRSGLRGSMSRIASGLDGGAGWRRTGALIKGAGWMEVPGWRAVSLTMEGSGWMEGGWMEGWME